MPVDVVTTVDISRPRDEVADDAADPDNAIQRLKEHLER